MSADFHIPPYQEPRPKNRFPIVAQLGVLGLVLVGLFGSLLLSNASPEAPAPQPIGTSAPEVPEVAPRKIEDVALRAEAAYVWDIKGQRALYSKNADEALPLASITKLMTAMLAHELIEANDMATVSAGAIRQEGASGLLVGERMTIGDLRELALVSSSNDAAYELGASVGSLLGDRDPVEQFVAGMNIRAEELGLETLQYRNTTGLDVSPSEPGAVGSARDVSFLMEHIVREYPDLLAPTQESAARIYNTAGAYHDVSNTNAVAEEIPNMLGSKTGYTDLAGGNLTIAFDAGFDRPVVITVLGSTRDQRFTDVLTLVAAVQDSLGSTTPNTI